MPLNSSEIERGIQHLRRVDPVLRPVIRKAGPFTLALNKDRFQSLVNAILSQQISGKAAMAIRHRLIDHLAPGKIAADRLCRLTVEELRTLGLSKQKAAYILDLSNRVQRGELRLNRMGRLSNQDVVDTLIEVQGIGEWTAQMFLIFSLGRLDVFPHADYGVRSAIQKLYGLDALPDRKTAHRIAEPWQPYASIAAWYCWRSLDNR